MDDRWQPFFLYIVSNLENRLGAFSKSVFENTNDLALGFERVGFAVDSDSNLFILIVRNKNECRLPTSEAFKFA